MLEFILKNSYALRALHKVSNYFRNPYILIKHCYSVKELIYVYSSKTIELAIQLIQWAYASVYLKFCQQYQDGEWNHLHKWNKKTSGGIEHASEEDKISKQCSQNFVHISLHII